MIFFYKVFEKFREDYNQVCWIICLLYVCVFFCSLNDLVEFIKVVDVGLIQFVEEGDYNGLVVVMGYLMVVKDRQIVIDEMFELLKQIIEFLKMYG